MSSPHDPLPSVAPSEVPEGAPLLDVREADEWDEVHVPWAQHVPMSALARGEAELQVPDEGPLYVTCHRGGRSSRVVAWLRQQGVDAVNVDGGMDAWEETGLPVVRGQA